jgi:AraC-like DNA-binding protein
MSDRPEFDSLSGLLARISLRASVFANPNVCGAWQVSTSSRGTAQFHLVARGACFLHLKGQRAPTALRAGDLCVLPRADWHVISPATEVHDDHLRLPTRGPGPRTSLVCGEFEVHDGAAGALLASLPRAIVVRTEDAGGALGRLLELMAAESLSGGPGMQAVLDRLSDALFVMVLRHHMASGSSRAGVLAALADPRLSRAIAAVQADPGGDWTLAAMARAAAMSRSAFAARFATVMGQTPAAWLGGWRMAEADRRFADPRATVARVAEALGYRTEAAFRRAYKRITGRTPGAQRRIARAPHA